MSRPRAAAAAEAAAKRAEKEAADKAAAEAPPRRRAPRAERAPEAAAAAAAAGRRGGGGGARRALDEKAKVQAARDALKGLASDLLAKLERHTATFSEDVEPKTPDEASVNALLAALRDGDGCFRGAEKPALEAQKADVLAKADELKAMERALAAKLAGDSAPDLAKLSGLASSFGGEGDSGAAAEGGDSGAAAPGGPTKQGSNFFGDAVGGLFKRAQSSMQAIMAGKGDGKGEDGKGEDGKGDGKGGADGAAAAAGAVDVGALEGAWKAMERAEYKYEANLEARLMDLEAKQRAEATEALAKPLRADGAAILAWIAASTKGLKDAADPAAWEGQGQDEIKAALAALDDAAIVDEWAAKEKAKCDVQAGLRDVATRLAAESGEAGQWSADPMVADLDDRWKEMIAAQAELRRLLMDKLNGLAAAEKAAATDDGLAAAEKAGQEWIDALAAAKKSFGDKEDLLAKASGGAAAPAKSLAPPGATATSEVARAFDGVLESKDGASVDPAKALGGKVVALYYAGDFCSASKKFTPMLTSVYDEVNANGKKLEVVFVSSDGSEDEM